MINSTISAPLVAMIKGQLATNGIHDPAITDALYAVDRSNYVPQAMQSVAYVDDDIKLCKGRYLLEPLLFALMLKHARIEPTHNVMDIGAGLGYSSAVIAQLAQHVTAIEDNAELIASARKKLAAHDINKVELVTAPLSAGCSAHAPYDRIIIEGAMDNIPATIEEQLADDGLIVAVRAEQALDASQKRFGSITVGHKQPHGIVYTDHERVSSYLIGQSATPHQFTF